MTPLEREKWTNYEKPETTAVGNTATVDTTDASQDIKNQAEQYGSEEQMDFAQEVDQ